MKTIGSFKVIFRYASRVRITASLRRREVHSLCVEKSPPRNADDPIPERDFDVRSVPRTRSEYSRQMKMRPVQPENPKFLRVAVVGNPNAGKSTLTNRLVGWRVCSVSSKVHTTRRTSSTVLSIDDTQLEFTDTPGTVNFETSMKHKLENSIVSQPMNSAVEADLLLTLVDTSNIYTRYEISPETKSLLEKNRHKPSILVLNKIDDVRNRSALVKVARKLCNGVVRGRPFGTEQKEELILPKDASLKKMLFKKMDQRLDGTAETERSESKGWSFFSEVFMVSAVTGEGVDSLLGHLLGCAVPHRWKYHSSVVVNNDPHGLAKQVVREKFLDTLKQEIGYMLRINIDSWEINDADVLRISMAIKCPKKNLVSMVIGPGGDNISKLSKSIQQELSNVFHCDVQVHLAVVYDKPL